MATYHLRQINEAREALEKALETAGMPWPEEVIDALANYITARAEDAVNDHQERYDHTYKSDSW